MLESDEHNEDEERKEKNVTTGFCTSNAFLSSISRDAKHSTSKDADALMVTLIREEGQEGQFRAICDRLDEKTKSKRISAMFEHLPQLKRDRSGTWLSHLAKRHSNRST